MYSLTAVIHHKLNYYATYVKRLMDQWELHNDLVGIIIVVRVPTTVVVQLQLLFIYIYIQM